MIIKKVTIKKLYGYIDKIIEFNSDINLIVGINGSGKTSVLNVIRWLLTPSISELCTNEFKELNIDFSYKKIDYLIKSKQTENSVTLEIFNKSEESNSYPPIEIDLKIPINKIPELNIEAIENLKEWYNALTPKEKNMNTWNLIYKEISNPVIIGLDRNLYTEEGGEISYNINNSRILRRRPNIHTKNNPLEKVTHLSSQEYNLYKDKIIDLNKELHNKIMLSSFDEIVTFKNIKPLLKKRKITLKTINSLEVKVKDYFSDRLTIHKGKSNTKNKYPIGTDEIINKYFYNLKEILTKHNSKEKNHENDIAYITNLNQFKKIADLIAYFEDYEEESKRLYQPLNQYLQTINHFLRDSAKELYFEKDTSKLLFRVLDENGKPIKEQKEIKDLSSGEMQILILFTFIKFNKKSGELFIIDEPELSLHPKWQEDFIDEIKKIMTHNTQLIFATHSPAIVGKHKKYCQALMPF